MSDARRIFDCFIFYNELDILDIRLHTLDPLVDRFVLVESTRTFTGQPKLLHYAENKARFAKFGDKITHIVVDDMPEDAESTYVREAHQRSAIGKGLANASPDDLIILSDADEIPKPDALRAALPRASGRITYFEGVYYHFFLNWRLPERKDLLPSRMVEYRNFRDGGLLRMTKGLRSASLPGWLEHLVWLPYAARRHRGFLGRQVMPEGCWHFSFISEPDKVREKLSAYKAPDRLALKDLRAEAVEERITKRHSMFDTPVEVVALEELPKYVQENADRFARILDLRGVGPAPLAIMDH